MAASDGILDLDATCHGADRSPAITWPAVAGATHALVLAWSPQAAGRQLHWQAWDASATEGGLPAGIPAAEAPPLQGLNHAGSVGWRGPCPAPGTVADVRFEVWLTRGPVAAPPTAGPAALQARARPLLLAAGSAELQARGPDPTPPDADAEAGPAR